MRSHKPLQAPASRCAASLHLMTTRSCSSRPLSPAVFKRMRVRAVFLMLMLIGVSCLAASPEPTTAREALKRHLLIVAVRPDYPDRSLTGSGVFEMKFDYESGRLREVHVVQSTGHPVLDAHTIAALKLWKAKPRSVHTLRLPITFGTPTK